jgi:tetratricopeptide (TPR) repeat protein
MGWYHQAGFRFNALWEKVNIWTIVSWGVVILLIRQGLPGWWFILGVLPNANLFATNSFVQDRYMYFGSIGIAMICAPFLHTHPEILLMACAFYVARSYMYSRHMVDDEALYRENWRNHKKSDFAVNNLSYFLIHRKRFEEARVLIHQGLAIDNRNKMLWYNLGITWAATGDLRTDEGKYRFIRAIDCWKQALQLEPRWAKPAEDIKRMTQFLLDNKVITMDVKQAGDGAATIDVPVNMGDINVKKA